MIAERDNITALVFDVSIALTTDAPFDDVLHRCTSALVEHLGVAFARIWIHDPSQHLLILRASSGLYIHLNGPHGRIPVGKYKIGLIAEERTPHLTNDVINDPRVSNPEWAKREGMVAFAGYPLVVDGQLLGVMACFSRRVLTENILHAMSAVANGIGLGIKRKQSEDALRELNKHLEREVQDRSLELQKKELELYQSRKLEAVGRLAGGIAHDFNNLLTGILGCSETLEEVLADTEHRLEASEIIKAAKRATALTKQLLAFSRQQIMAPKNVDLNSLIADTSTLMQRLLGEDIELTMDLDTKSCDVFADASQLDQVIMNISINARDAMPQGGKLRLETRRFRVEAETPFVGINQGEYTDVGHNLRFSGVRKSSNLYVCQQRRKSNRNGCGSKR